RGLRVRAPIEAGRHLLAGSDLPAAVGDEARGPAQVVGGDRVLPVGAHEVARLPGHVPVDPFGDIRAGVRDGHLGQLAHELPVLGRGALPSVSVSESAATPRERVPAGPWSSMVTSRSTPSCWASSAKAAPPTPSRSSPPTAPTVARRRETAVL